MSDDSTLLPAELCLKLYREQSSDVQILYKYRHLNKERIESELLKEEIWLSTRDQLNDPFDINIVFPQTIEQDDVNIISRLGQNFNKQNLPRVETVDECLHFISQSKAVTPLQALYLVAIQLGDEGVGVVKHLKKINNGYKWSETLIKRTIKMFQTYFSELSVFSLSETSTSNLMWGHYANSFKGYCIGYVCWADHITPKIIHPVTYKNEFSVARASEFILKSPDGLIVDLMCQKQSVWSYEKEKRFIGGIGMAGLTAGLFAPKKIIFGYQVSTDVINDIRAMCKNKDYEYYIAKPLANSSSFEIEIVAI